MKVLFALLLLITLASCQLHNSNIKPQSTLHKTTKPINTFTLPAVDVVKAKAEEAKEVGQAPRFGVSIPVKYSTEDATMELVKGGALYRMRFISKGAFFTMIQFKNFKLTKGSSLHIIETESREFLGAFTHENNKVDGSFSIGPIHGESFTLELYEPMNNFGSSKLDIDTIAHSYKDLFSTKQTKNGRSGTCNINVVCEDGDSWRDQIRGVGLMLRSSGARFCSGSLINNADNKDDPLFLTANHCGTNTNGWVIMFNYHANSCSERSSRNTRDTVSGATSIANHATSDFHLVRLTESPARYNVFLNGWSRVDRPSEKVVGIHHPSGDNKKISFSNRPVLSYGYQRAGDTHWRVTRWDKGTTEGGSSGSPLFDTNKRIIGQLHGGTASCRNMSGWDGYGKIWKSWNIGWTGSGRLRNHLDPSNTGVETVNGRNLK